MALLLRRKNSFRNPSLIHLFSTSSSHSNSNSKSNEDEPESSASDDRDSSKPQSSFGSSYFSDIKKKLSSQQSSSTFRSPSTPSFTASGSGPQRSSSVSYSLEEIRKNLSSFRSRYSESSSSSAPSSNTTSFQEIYERNVTGKQGVSPPIGDSASGRLGIDLIRQTLQNSKPNVGSLDSAGKGQLMDFTKSLRMKANSQTSSPVIGGTGELPEYIFGREMREKEAGKMSEEGRLLFVKTYKPEELGNKLRKLRPETKGKDWFSLSELNDRLMKLREMEEKANDVSVKGITAKDLRDVLTKIKVDDAVKKNNFSDKFDILGELGRKPSFMLKPPQEHLVEKYFHPDNMSSQEKLKIELAKVRDEFKMSESDCGSSRVQVAQLTTKIKHLSSVLHKKDKHSRKGLIAMVQKRKRLLKYLRRTDWDSYCFVISKLGLRDNPDTKY